MKLLRPGLSLLLAALCFGSSSIAQVKGKPQVTSTVIVDTDDPCRLSIDGIDRGLISPNESKTLQVSLGEHILKCTVRGVPRLAWRTVIQVKNSDGLAAIISLKGLHMLYETSNKQQSQIDRYGSQIAGKYRGADAQAEPRRDAGFQGSQPTSAGHEAERSNSDGSSRTINDNMQVHFDAGVLALERAEQLRSQIDGLPWNRQADIRAQLAQASGTAVTELRAAADALPETNVNSNIILADLGQAYELEDQYADAVRSYQQAIALEPDPFYYNRLGNSLARIGRLDEAAAAFAKATELDPMNAAHYSLNLAIGLYNAGRVNDSIEPLKKATENDPQNAHAWYLLGAALASNIEFGGENDRVKPILRPGVVEAYQKASQLDPNGTWGAQAKRALQLLQAMGVSASAK